MSISPFSHAWQDLKVGPDLLYEAYLKVVKTVIPEGGHFVAMGHSLGTAPIRRLYFHASDLSQAVDQFVMITPIPAERESRGGFSFNSLFMQGTGLMMLFRIDIRPMSLIDGFAILNEVREHPMLDPLASQDPRLIWVLAGKDHMFPTQNLEEWESSNVHILHHAGHAFLLASREEERWATYFHRILTNGIDPKKPKLNPKRLMRGIQTRLFVQGSFSSELEGGGAVRLEVNAVPEPHFEASLGGRGGIEGGENLRFPVTAYLESRFHPDLDTPVHAAIGIEQSYDLRAEEGLDPFVYGAIRYELYRAMQVGLKIGFDLDEDRGYQSGQPAAIFELSFPIPF